MSHAERKRRHAERQAGYRERTRGRPESRVTDRVLVEAIAVHAKGLDPVAAKELLATLFALASDGLRHEGYPELDAKAAVKRRLGPLLENPSGSVVAGAKARAEGRKPGGFRQRTP